MSGDIADLPVRRCPVCGQVFMEDEQMYADPQHCPACGTDTASSNEKGEES